MELDKVATILEEARLFIGTQQTTISTLQARLAETEAKLKETLEGAANMVSVREGWQLAPTRFIKHIDGLSELCAMAMNESCNDYDTDFWTQVSDDVSAAKGMLSAAGVE